MLGIPGQEPVHHNVQPCLVQPLYYIITTAGVGVHSQSLLMRKPLTLLKTILEPSSQVTENCTLCCQNWRLIINRCWSATKIHPNLNEGWLVLIQYKNFTENYFRNWILWSESCFICADLSVIFAQKFAKIRSISRSCDEWERLLLFSPILTLYNS